MLRTPVGTIVKLFRTKRPLSSAHLYSHARRFADNAVRLAEMGIPSVQILDVRRLAWPPRDVVIYRELSGETLGEILSVASPERVDRCLLHLAGFIALLHRKGIYFRSLHLGNVLALSDGRLGLIDVSDLRVRSRELGPRARARNFRHLLRREQDKIHMERFGLQDFYSEYCRKAGFGPLTRRLISGFLTRSWTGLASGRISTDPSGV